MTQDSIRFHLKPSPSVPRWQSRADQAALNSPRETPNSPSHRHQERVAALLKRQAREIMHSITECPPAQIAGHVCRAKDWRDIAHQVIAAGAVDPDEGRLSGRALIFCDTLADHLAAVEITCRDHRATAFVSAEARELAEINHKLDTLAAFLGGRRAE